MGHDMNCVFSLSPKIQPAYPRSAMRRPLQLAQFPNFIKNTQDLWLFTKMWPVPEPRGIVFICHGYGEHILRYFNLLRFFLVVSNAPFCRVGLF